MIETSKDLLFVVLALCILWLTVFLSWLLYYVISILRDANAVIRLLKNTATKIDSLAHGLQERLDKSAATFALVARALKEVVIWVIDQRRAEGGESARRRSSGTKRPVEEGKDKD